MKKIACVLGGLLLSACSDSHLEQGAELYKQNCRVCHGQGINGAPVLGNSKMWAARKDQSVETLVQHAAEGFGLMPARGGSSLDDGQLELVVRYMLSELEK